MTEYAVLRPFTLKKVSDMDWRLVLSGGPQIGGACFGLEDVCATALALGLIGPFTRPIPSGIVGHPNP